MLEKPGGENDRQAHCVGPKEVFPGYTRAKPAKAGAEIIEAARTGAQVGLRGFEEKHTAPFSLVEKKFSLEFVHYQFREYQKGENVHICSYLNICHIPVILFIDEKQSYGSKMFFPISL